MKPNILVTGATGKTGAALVAELCRSGWPVRAVVSREDGRSAKLRQMGAEIAVADMYDAEQLTLAAQGTQRAYYLPLMQPYMIQAASAFVIAVREAKLEYILQMSQWTSAAAHPASMTRQTWLTDRLFSMIPGVAHTILNPGMFADNFLRTLDFAALLGIFPVLMGDSKCAPISNEDMARAAAALLTADDPAVHAGKSYHPTGRELLSGKEMARIVATVVGHAVVPVNLPIWMFRKVARLQGVEPYQIAMLIHYIEDNKQGAFSIEGGVTRVMEELTGSAAEPFKTTAARYAAQPFALQTPGNRLKAVANFAITPFHPGYNINAYERSLDLPTPAKPLRCMEDPRWRESRTAQMGEPAASPRKTSNAEEKELRRLATTLLG